MEQPLAFVLTKAEGLISHSVSIDSHAKSQLGTLPNSGPAIIVARKAVVVAEASAGMFDLSDVVSYTPGAGADAVLIVLPRRETTEVTPPSKGSSGDEKFLAHVKHRAPQLAELARETLVAIRNAGVEGELSEGTGGRWINKPINTFTLKSQPRAGNLHFTLYGNPHTYSAGDFLRKDQNSYSRGWVKDRADAEQLAKLAKESHSRPRR